MSVVKLMKKPQRLLTLLQMLRNYRYPVTADRLAARLNISVRTLYRDIIALQSMGAEIIGEAGIGYQLKPTFFLPPLMFNQIEMQALLLGMRWVLQYGDASLSNAASEVLTKVNDVLPANIKNSVNTSTLRVGPPASDALINEDLSQLREAIAKQSILKIIYKNEKNKKLEQIIWPFTIGYFTNCRILVAWNEEEKKFLHFKTDKIINFQVLNQSYSYPKENLFREWQKLQLQK